jgi:hypothetical protein
MNCNNEFKENVALFLNGDHCFVHKTNLAMIPLFDLELVHRLEVVLQNLYTFFVHKPKKFLEFQELADLINTKGNKLLQNVKT